MPKIIIIDEEDWKKYIPEYMLHSDISLKIRTLTDEEIEKHCRDECNPKKSEEFIKFCQENCNLIKKLKGE